MRNHICYVDRPDVPYKVFKRIAGDGPEFTRVYADGTWTSHDSKLKSAPVVAQGSDVKEIN